MGFHLEEAAIFDGSIDNRIKGRTLLRFNFTNHTSSLVTLQGNPCRDLAGSLWSFTNPHARMDEQPSAPHFFIPALCEGAVGRISYSKRCAVPILPPDEHYDRLFDSEKEDPLTNIAPVLELEWFSQKFKQVEIDCELMTLELIEMAWSLTAEEAAVGEAAIKQSRAETVHEGDDWAAGFAEDMELIEEYVGEDPEPHEIEELCFIILQDFVNNTADGSEEKQELHTNLLKLQEQIGGAFIHLDYEGGFDDVPATIRLLNAVIPLLDRTAESARYHAETTHEFLLHLKEGIISLRKELQA